MWVDDKRAKLKEKLDYFLHRIINVTINKYVKLTDCVKTFSLRISPVLLMSALWDGEGRCAGRRGPAHRGPAPLPRALPRPA